MLDQFQLPEFSANIDIWPANPTAWHIQESEKNIQHCNHSDSLFPFVLNQFLLIRIIDVAYQRCTTQSKVVHQYGDWKWCECMWKHLYPAIFTEQARSTTDLFLNVCKISRSQKSSQILWDFQKQICRQNRWFSVELRIMYELNIIMYELQNGWFCENFRANFAGTCSVLHWLGKCF